VELVVGIIGRLAGTGFDDRIKAAAPRGKRGAEPRLRVPRH